MNLSIMLFLFSDGSLNYACERTWLCGRLLSKIYMFSLSFFPRHYSLKFLLFLSLLCH